MRTTSSLAGSVPTKRACVTASAMVDTAAATVAEVGSDDIKQHINCYETMSWNPLCYSKPIMEAFLLFQRFEKKCERKVGSTSPAAQISHIKANKQQAAFHYHAWFTLFKKHRSYSNLQHVLAKH